jgi:hypothetical protein
MEIIQVPMKQKQISLHYDRFVDASLLKFQECACLHQQIQVNFPREKERPLPTYQSPTTKKTSTKYSASA